MRTKTRLVLIELLWLTSSIALTILLSLFIFSRAFFSDSLDIHLHDTYYVPAPLNIILPMFLFMNFTIYFVREFRRSFGRGLQNGILLVTGLTILVSLSFLINLFSPLTTGFTIYPPLSALSTENIAQPEIGPIANPFIKMIILMQVLILIVMLFISYRWGKHSAKISSAI